MSLAKRGVDKRARVVRIFLTLAWLRGHVSLDEIEAIDGPWAKIKKNISRPNGMVETKCVNCTGRKSKCNWVLWRGVHETCQSFDECRWQAERNHVILFGNHVWNICFHGCCDCSLLILRAREFCTSFRGCYSSFEFCFSVLRRIFRVTISEVLQVFETTW